jgi:hypothetical protein
MQEGHADYQSRPLPFKAEAQKVYMTLHDGNLTSGAMQEGHAHYHRRPLPSKAEAQKLYMTLHDETASPRGPCRCRSRSPQSWAPGMARGRRCTAAAVLHRRTSLLCITPPPSAAFGTCLHVCFCACTAQSCCARTICVCWEALVQAKVDELDVCLRRNCGGEQHIGGRQVTEDDHGAAHMEVGQGAGQLRAPPATRSMKCGVSWAALTKSTDAQVLRNPP